LEIEKIGEFFFADATALRPDAADQNSVNVKRRFGDCFLFIMAQ
jgi:hypothetical protein